MRQLKRWDWVCVMLLAMGLAASVVGCGTDPAPSTTKTDTKGSKTDTASGGEDSATVSDGAGDTAVVESDVPATADVPKGDSVSDAPSTGCLTDDQCAKQLASTIKLCEQAKCDTGTGQCKTAPKAGYCCDDLACDDKNEGTVDKCNPDTAKCEYKTAAGFCPGKVVVLKTFFEQNSLEGYQAQDGATNGNVKWKVDNKRAHNGKTSLYFGNECYTYDASMTAATSCTGGGTGGAISTTLKSPTVTLPAGKQMMLHFWLFLATEPTWLDLGSPKGSCTGCPADTTCIVNDGKSLCAPEKDLLKLKVNNDEVWSSLSINKTTKGQWMHVAVDLAKYTGAGVAFSWEFKTANGLKNAYEGIYMDDIVVESICDTKENNILCDSQTKCTDDQNPCTSNDCTGFVNAGGGAGICFFDSTPGCCVGVIDCDDLNDCTKDSCNKPSADAAQGVCKNVPNASNSQCCSPSNYLTEGFDNGTSTWTSSGNSTTVQWQKNPKGGTNESPSLYFGDATFGSYDDQAILPKGKGPSGVICSKALTLQSGTIYNVATFNLNLSTEWDGKASFKNPPDLPPGTPAGVTAAKVDELKVILKIAGQYCGATECKAPGTYIPDGLWSSDFIKGTTDGKWLPVVVNLDKYAGKEVQVCFSFDAGDNLSNKAKGVNIDDVKVDVVCAEMVCSYDAQCASQCGQCEVASCQSGQCLCQKDPNCCGSDAGCDDSDTCTTDKCTNKVCSHTLTSPTCCSNKTAITEDLSGTGGQLPVGWKATSLTGQPAYAGGAQYSKLASWGVTSAKAPPGKTFSLHFNNNAPTYNTGPEVPAGLLRSGDIVLPPNGTDILTFQLSLSTEWDGAVKSPADLFAGTDAYTDRLRVGLYDPNEKDQAKNTVWIWSSFDIAGTTNGSWRDVVVQIPDAWKGKTARLQFEFDAGTTANNNFAGAYVGDIQLSVVCDKPECILDKACVPASNPDPCKTYYCAKDPKALLFSCKNDFKPGPTCCQSSYALKAESFEGGKITDTKWTPAEASGNVNWQVIPHKYLGGKYELYYGNSSANPLNYANGVSPVEGVLDGPSVLLSTDLKKGAKLVFKMYLDIEKGQPEKFQIRVSVPGANIQNEVLWDHSDPKYGFNPGAELKTVVEKKIDLFNYKGKGEIKINFFFDSGDGLLNDKYQGIFLDDISIQEDCL